LVVAALLVVTACSGGSDDAVEVPAADSSNETTTDVGESESDDAAGESADGADGQAEPVVGDAVSGGEVSGGEVSGEVSGEVESGSDVDEDADGGGFTINGPARVRASCDSLTRGANDFTIESGGFVYDVRLFVPTTVSSDPAPVVLDWHGLGSNGQEQVLYSGYETLAEQEGFIAVHPTGQESSWELSQFDTPERDDLAFADALIDAIVRDWCVDETRVYSTGMSNGGLFTSELVCNRSNRIAAAASVAGTSHADDCDPERPVPYIAFHGTADTVVPFGGGEESVLLPPESVDALIGEGTPSEFAEFAADNGCAPEPQRTEESDEVIRYDYVDCENDIPMTFYEIVGGGHTWPSSPIADPSADLEASGFTFDVDATADAWAFMSQFSL
jgi:polyhydroxybutyrate depolymerase